MEDVEIRGCLIPKGDTVMTIQASANRDEDVWEHLAGRKLQRAT